LVVEELVVHRQGAPVVRGVSLDVQRGELLALLGANGAGKSTLLLAISGALPVVSGRVAVDGKDITALPPEIRARYVTHIPEGRRLFTAHSVRENLMLGASRSARSVATERLAKVFETFPKLHRLKDRAAAQLSGGEQQMVALGRGMMSGAEIIMIDELSLGLAPKVASEFARSLGALRDSGYAVLLVEQYISLALNVADKAMVLNRGMVVRSRPALEMLADRSDLQRSYLGDEPAPARVDGDVTETVLELDTADVSTSPGAPATRGRRSPDPERRALLVALAGAALSVVSFTLPWFAYTTVSGASGNQFVWDIPLPALYIATLAVALMLAVTLVARPRFPVTSSPMSRTVAGAALAVAAAAFTVAVVVRTWMFNAGLGGAQSYTRSWGLLVALHGAAFLCLGLVAAARVRRHAKQER
jgi:branched-chain amino acid transport system ATP-binding protein